MHLREENYHPRVTSAEPLHVVGRDPRPQRGWLDRPTVDGVVESLESAEVDYEVIVVDDRARTTPRRSSERCRANPRIRYHRSHNPRGYGYTVRAGLDVFDGDAVAIVMADGSDDPADLVRYHAFSKRAMTARRVALHPRTHVYDYPRFKLALNRVVNLGIRVLFRHGYNDTTNAFKAYRREVIETVQPLLSNHFNLTVEIPLKAIVRGHSYTVIPISWRNRREGESKLSLQEMGSRYAFIVLYVLLERHLSRGDYRRRQSESVATSRQRAKAQAPTSRR